jgi:hypothetical protein
MTKIMKCFCDHKFQDQAYGPGKRVFNETTKKGTPWRCTVCGKLSTEGGEK